MRFENCKELGNILDPAPVVAVRVTGVAAEGAGDGDKPEGHFRRTLQLSCSPPQTAPRGFLTRAGTVSREWCTSAASCRRTWKDASGSGSVARRGCCSSCSSNFSRRDCIRRGTCRSPEEGNIIRLLGKLVGKLERRGNINYGQEFD